MNKRSKQFSAFAVAAFLLIYPATSLRAESSNPESNLLKLYTNQEISQIEYYQDVFQFIKNNDLLTMNNENHLIVSPLLTDYFDSETCEYIMKAFSSFNREIDFGTVSFNYDKFEFTPGNGIGTSNKNYAERKYHEERNAIFQQFNDSKVFSDQKSVSYAAATKTIWVYGICNENKNEIKDLLRFYLEVSPSNPTGAYSNAVSAWVSRVRPGGVWDYKLVSGYANFLLSDIPTAYQRLISGTFSAEYFGNFNYAYTGEYLFSRQVLIAGSIAAAGFSIKKDQHDWPAINAGYDAAVRMG